MVSFMKKENDLLLEQNIFIEKCGKSFLILFLRLIKLAARLFFCQEALRGSISLRENAAEWLILLSWKSRNAFSQLHQNLNSAIMLAVRCLYYKNGSYVPPENRILYYSYSLEKLPENYKFLLSSLFQQQIDSYSDYERREKLFKNEFMKFLIWIIFLNISSEMKLFCCFRFSVYELFFSKNFIVCGWNSRLMVLVVPWLFLMIWSEMSKSCPNLSVIKVS